MQLIAFAGCDGAGKSTLIRAVAQELRTREFHVDVVDKWDIFDPLLHPECEFLARGPETFKKCVPQMQGPARAMLIFWMIAQSVRRIGVPTDLRSGEQRYVLLDGYWMKHAAAELVRGTSRELIDTLVDALPPADITFLLDLDPQHAAARKSADISPYECGLSSAGVPRDFIKHQTKLREALRDGARRNLWHTLDAQHDPDVLAETVLRNILQPGDVNLSPPGMNICQHSMHGVQGGGNVRASGELERL